MAARWGVVVVVGAALAAVVAGCGGSGFTYLSNSRDGAFFKVPAEWGTFDEAELLESGGEPSEDARDALDDDRIWLWGFDGSEKPSPGNVTSSASDAPRGFAEVRRLTPEERGSIDLVALRSIGLPTDPSTGSPVDPVSFAQRNPSGPVRVLRYEDDLVFDGGAHGVRIALLIQADEPWVVEHIAAVDAATTKRYLLSIGCSLDCWTEHEDVIQDVLESWTLREER